MLGSGSRSGRVQKGELIISKIIDEMPVARRCGTKIDERPAVVVDGGKQLLLLVRSGLLIVKIITIAAVAAPCQGPQYVVAPPVAGGSLAPV